MVYYVTTQEIWDYYWPCIVLAALQVLIFRVIAWTCTHAKPVEMHYLEINYVMLAGAIALLC